MSHAGTLEIRSLTKRYNGIPAVDDVSFIVRPGEVLGYLGPNGAGKSTTVKMIVGLLDPSDGQILYEGRSIIHDLPEFQRRIGYVPEEPTLCHPRRPRRFPPHPPATLMRRRSGRLHPRPPRDQDRPYSGPCAMSERRYSIGRHVSTWKEHER
jgi:ABC-type ATPase with predicted acetyltransferase domain